MSEPIKDCPQPETPIRERAWTDEQRWQMFRRYLAAENDTFMDTFHDNMVAYAALNDNECSKPEDSEVECAKQAYRAMLAAAPQPEVRS